jgi:hypothetical protein
MYTPAYPEASRDLPPGYRGETFREEPCVPEASEAHADRETMAPSHAMRRGGLRELLGHIDLKELLTGDLLLIAIALLLFFSKDEDGCDEKDDDLWLLLVILFFLK